MKTVKVENSVGMVLGHDITRIVAGQSKGRAFKKGHVIKSEDIPALLDLGKENIYIWELADNHVHEDDAALILARNLAGSGLTLSEPSEGRINLHAEHKGLLTVKPDTLLKINRIDNITAASLHGNQTVQTGQAVAGTRIIPLSIHKDALSQVEAICRQEGPVMQVLPFQPHKVGIITTGSEVYHGRIKDQFGPVLYKKYEELGCPVLGQTFVPDDISLTLKAIEEFVANGAEMIALTGGMSVDPDDLTPSAIRATGARVVTYGTPVFPGAMFLLAYLGSIPLLGLPGCVMYHGASIFDLVVPRLVAGQHLEREDLMALGHGGFCLNCQPCRFPVCGFGKSV